LDDLERWGLGFTRSQPQNTNVLITGPNTVSLSIAAGDNKFVWGLPSNDVTLNPYLKPQNPGW
jgi:starch-binding outer membrane protein, SusD/RagB family